MWKWKQIFIPTSAGLRLRGNKDSAGNIWKCKYCESDYLTTMISTCGHQKRLCCTFTKSCPTIFTNLRDLTILLGVDIVCKPNVKYLFLAILMHCIELHFLTIALDAVICNLIAMVDAFAKFHRLHVGVVDCRMWVISRRLAMCATCHRVHWHMLHCCSRWNCCSSWGWGLLTLELRLLLVDLTRWQGQVAFSQERVCARWWRWVGREQISDPPHF